MNQADYGYGLWSLVVLNSAIFIFFAFSFAKPRVAGDWRSLGVFSGFIIALFTEMYDFPLTIYLLSGWLQKQFPQTDFFSHDSGHLWHTLLGWKMNPHFDPLHILSNLIIVGGFWLLASAWRVLYVAQKSRSMATGGIYARLRHPQYLAFIVIMFGFLLQWPTLPTLVMFPVLVYVYVRLAKREEAVALAAFGRTYQTYMQATPGFIPRFTKSTVPRAGQALH